jgi:hypothetical protein
MVRRKPQTLRPVINDATEIVDAERGAIVVYGCDKMKGLVCYIVHRGFVTSVIFESRSIKRRPYICAVFGHVEPGQARIMCEAAGKRAGVEVEAGKVSQVDWRSV